MLKKNCSVFVILICTILLFGGCNKASKEDAPVNDIEIIDNSPTENLKKIQENEEICFPRNTDKAYAALAISLSQEAYDTFSADSIHVGDIFLIQGKLKAASLETQDSFDFPTAVIETEYGDVVVVNLYETVYESTVEKKGTQAAINAYGENAEDFVFPENGTEAFFLTVYYGYATKLQLPVFILGADKNIFYVASLSDPLQ